MGITRAGWLWWVALVALAAGSGCGGPQVAVTVDPHKTVTVHQGPCQVTTPAGAALQVPAGLSLRQRGGLLELRDAERSVQVHLLETEADSCEQGLRKGWAAVASPVHWTRQRLQQPPARPPYDEICVASYVPRKDRRVAQAVVRRRGKRAWVSIISGTPAQLDRRVAQIRVFLASLKPPGAPEQDLARVQPRSVVPAENQLEAFVQHAMELTHTPGLALAVVEGNKVVLSQGFGVRKLGQPAPVTAQTRMLIGSVSKSLTTLMMAMLVDQGKLRWEQRVTEVAPEFKLGDRELTKTLQVQQLVCACAGLPRKDMPLVLAFAGKSAPDVLRELAGMHPSTGLGETFQYQNHMVAAGGYIAGRAFDPQRPLGVSYDEAMSQLVFGPLGMRSTSLAWGPVLRADDRATPYSEDLSGEHREVALDAERFTEYVRPSGGIWSTASDMARYLIHELRRGVTPEGRRLVSEANLTHRWQPQVKISADLSYALGWMVGKERGLRFLRHGGGTMGFATLVAFLPDHGRGVVMLSNGTGGHLVEGMVWKRLLELWFGADFQASATLDFAIKQRKQSLARLAKRMHAPEAKWIEPLLGSYENPELGRWQLRRQGSEVRLSGKSYHTVVLQHDRPDGKRALIFRDPPLAGLELIPVPGQTGRLELRRAQERYVLRRTGR